MENNSEQDIIRAPTPNKNKNEIFAVVGQILGGSRMNVKCQDGKTRMARIPGGKRRRLGRIRIGDLILIIPWEVQDEKADIVYRYRSNQINLLRRKHVLPDEFAL